MALLLVILLPPPPLVVNQEVMLRLWISIRGTIESPPTPSTVSVRGYGSVNIAPGTEYTTPYRL